MGIPYYFYSLTKKYQNILDNNKPLKTDIYCIDFNGIIHTVAQKILKDKTTESLKEEEIDELILEGIWKKVEDYIDIYKAKKYVICADGVAPTAKIIQQRKRRYLNIYKNNLDKDHMDKPIWDTNAITPGTSFMKKLNVFMDNKIRYSTHNIEIIYSGSNESGEGEHKIFKKIKILVCDKTDTIIINGLDADLIILSLMSHIKNIHLMRETIDKTTNEIVYNYLNINNLRTAILKELVFLWNLNIKLYVDNDIIESYCTLCSILGNDFVPHLLTVDIKIDGVDKIISIARKATEEYGLLVSDNTINYECLKYIFKQLSLTEDKDIFIICEKYINKKIFNNSSLPSDNYALKNKDKLCYNIYNDNTRWHKNYYNMIFENNITIDSSVIYNSCSNYIKGIYWVYQYYKGYGIDCDWYYPYNYPPTLKDISNHSIAHDAPIINVNNNFLDPNIQLLIVLPKDSIHLVNHKYKKYMTDIYSGLFHMYPVNYNIQTFLKTHLWECSPILPLINIDYIKYIISMFPP
jgi:5'-3' exoribonuclease 2